MKTLLPGFSLLCLSFLLCACPMQPNPVEPSSDTGIRELTAGEFQVSEILPGSFAVALGSTVTEVFITVSTEDPGATTMVAKAGTLIQPEAGGIFRLSGLIVGENFFVVTIEAEDGVSSRDYPLVITRAAPPPVVVPDLIALSFPADQEEGIGPLPVLSWERSKKAVYWKVFFSEGSIPSLDADSGEFYLISPEWVPPMPLEPNTTYAWQVVPYKTNGLPMDPSEIRTFVTGDLPSAPTNLTVSQAESDPHLVLQWGGSMAAEGYMIYRNGASTPFMVSASGTDLTWIDTAPVSGLNVYEVWAFNSFGTSASAAQAQGTPGSGGSVVIIFK